GAGFDSSLWWVLPERAPSRARVRPDLKSSGRCRRTEQPRIPSQMAGRPRRDLRRPAARSYVGLVWFGACCGRGGPGLAPGGWGGCVFGCAGEASRGGTPVLPAIGFFPVLITHLHVVWVRLDVLPNHGVERYRARPAGSQGPSHFCLFCNTKARRHLAGGLFTSFVVRTAPEDMLLLETDAPYLEPEPRSLKRNERSLLTRMVKRLCELREWTPEQ